MLSSYFFLVASGRLFIVFGVFSVTVGVSVFDPVKNTNTNSNSHTHILNNNVGNTLNQWPASIVAQPPTRKKRGINC